MDMSRKKSPIFHILISSVLLAVSCKAHLAYKETHCLTHDVQNIRIACPTDQTIGLEYVRYVAPPHSHTPPFCEEKNTVQGINDLIMDLGTILNYKCDGKSVCTLPVEWDTWHGLIGHYMTGNGQPYIQLEYSCTDQSHGLPHAPLMLSSTERTGDNVHKYGCHRRDHSPSAMDIQCTSAQDVIHIDSAVIAQSTEENRCSQQKYAAPLTGGRDALDTSILQDLALDVKKTVSALCTGKRYCEVPVDWDTMESTLQYLASGYNYFGEMYLDIKFTCVDVNVLTTQPPPFEIPSEGVHPEGETSANVPVNRDTNKTQSDDKEFPLIVIGIIGIVFLILVATGVICMSTFIRRRRMHHAHDYKDMVDPTYNTTVQRSEYAPQSKFDNIRYDSDRHPSGVYDVPRSTTTTPGVSHVAPPDFASNTNLNIAHLKNTKVKVEIEDDDDSSLHQVHVHSLGSTKNAAQNGENFRDSQTTLVSCYADTLHGVKRRGNEDDKKNTVVTMSGQGPVTKLRDGSLPMLPPRTPSMPNIDDLKHSSEYSADECSSTAPSSQQSLPSDTPNVLDPEYMNVLRAKKPVYTKVHKSPETSASGNGPEVAQTLPTGQYSQQNSLADDVFDSPQAMDFRTMRLALQSGAYDNNMDNMPSSPYCYKTN